METNEMIGYEIGDCALGALLVATSERGICAILMGDDAGELARDLQRRFPQAALILGAVTARYFARVASFIASPRAGLDLPLDLRGSEFRQRVWHELRAIPAGTLQTYGEIARRIGAPRAAQEVGEACAANQLAVAIPCHRVVRSDGTPAGYRWGVKRKLALLKLEGARLGPTPDLFEKAPSSAIS